MRRGSLSSAIVCSLNIKKASPHYGESRRIGRMIWKKTNLCKRWGSCSSPRKSASVWCRAKILAALAKRFADLWACKKNGPGRKRVLAMIFMSDTNNGVRRPLSTCLRREKDYCLYSDFDRFLRSALRGHGLPFRRISSKRTVYSQRTGCGWRHDHSASGNILLGDNGHHYERHYLGWPDYD